VFRAMVLYSAMLASLAVRPTQSETTVVPPVNVRIEQQNRLFEEQSASDEHGRKEKSMLGDSYWRRAAGNLVLTITSGTGWRQFRRMPFRNRTGFARIDAEAA